MPRSSSTGLLSEGVQVREEHLLEGFGALPGAGGVPGKPERLQPSAFAEGVQREKFELGGAVPGGE